MRKTVIATMVLGMFVGACATDEPAYRTPRAGWQRQSPPHVAALKPRPAQRPPARRVQQTTYVPRGQTWFPARGKTSSRWTTIVIHHSATSCGGAASFDRYHRQNGWDELGYHFVIGNGTNTGNGQIEVGARWHKQKHGAHCKTSSNYYNNHGIGICLVGNFNKTRPTEAQLASLEQLVRFLCRECGIPPKRVTTHHCVTHKTDCPGRYFSLARLHKSITAAPTATASSMP